MTTDTVGGVWQYSMQLCKALQKYDITVHLAAMGGLPSAAQLKEAGELENLNLYTSDFKLEWMDDPWGDIVEARQWLQELCTAVQPDLIQFNNYIWLNENQDCPILTVFHSCVLTWWKGVKDKNAPAEWDRYADHVKKALDSSDVVVFPTEAIMEQAVSVYGKRATDRMIYNAREKGLFGSRPKENMILCSGRLWDEAKNITALTAIAEALPWPVYVAGGEIAFAKAETEMSKNIKFLGRLSTKELREWMQRAQIYVNPAKYEPFGLAVLEAAHAGCALVLNDINTLRELWDGDALFFDAEKPNELQTTLLDLITKPDLLAELQEKATRKAETYTVETMGKAYYDCYQEMISSKIKINSLTSLAS